MAQIVESELMTVKEAAQEVRLSRAALYQRLRRRYGKLGRDQHGKGVVTWAQVCGVIEHIPKRKKHLYLDEEVAVWLDGVEGSQSRTAEKALRLWAKLEAGAVHAFNGEQLSEFFVVTIRIYRQTLASGITDPDLDKIAAAVMGEVTMQRELYTAGAVKDAGQIVAE